TPQPSPDHDLQKARGKAAPQPLHIIPAERQGHTCGIRLCNFIYNLKHCKNCEQGNPDHTAFVNPGNGLAAGAVLPAPMSRP
ncbi:MAG: hypothetical protein PHW09_14330, partial [Desulfovibrio desulfuricans]|nr:hypothetical protein [Desulfovibrio desulfuricans]